MIEETWELSTRENGYACVPDNAIEAQAVNAIGHNYFRAVSVGGPHGQVAIIPLDESSIERGQLIARTPEMARLLLCAWHDELDREVLEKFLTKSGIL